MGYVADLAAGDPRRWHPVAGFGAAAASVESVAYAPSRLRGAIVVGALVSGASLAAAALARAAPGPALAAVTWAALGGRSLRHEALAIAAALEGGDLDGARLRLPALCGRDPAELSAAELSRAVVESLAENTSDAVVGALLWGALAGPAGVAGYRAANTLDAMFGHRSERYASFGWAAAKLDDVINWPAARCSAAITCAAAPLVGGSPARTLSIVLRDGAAHPSPNAGRAEAAFAGALDVRLGGPLVYAGRDELRPQLGDGPAPEPADIRRAARLSLAVGAIAALAAAVVRGAIEATAVRGAIAAGKRT
ncbi:MAG: cobalamin biosynthesis protein [Solirubrobacteraceae bacterium]